MCFIFHHWWLLKTQSAYLKRTYFAADIYANIFIYTSKTQTIYSKVKMCVCLCVYAANCYPKCKNGGVCLRPEKCRCPPGFGGRYCHKGKWVYLEWTVNEISSCACASGHLNKECFPSSLWPSRSTSIHSNMQLSLCTRHASDYLNLRPESRAAGFLTETSLKFSTGSAFMCSY